MPAWAADPAGRWALRSGDATLMVFEVVRARDGWSGVWLRPAHFSSDGDNFSDLAGPMTRQVAQRVQAVPDGVKLSFDGPGGRADVFILRASDAKRGTLSFVAFGDEPAILTRVAPSVMPGGWEHGQVYVRPVDRPTDAEMTALFDADQAARADPNSINWKVLTAEDAKRRARTQALLDAGRLRSGEDFYHAAFVFQHGDKPEDFLKAHALAVIAAARGKPQATWIAAATLDRYLQNIGQPQVYGTQFQHPTGKPWTQEPYRRELLSDALRKASGVPPLSEQQEQLKVWERDLP